MQAGKEEFSKRFSTLTKHMSADDVQTLLQALTPLNLHRGEILINDGETCDAIYFVQKGILEASIVEKGEKVQLGLVTSGQWLGEVSMIDPGPATATVTAISDCELLRLGRSSFEALDQQRPMLMNVILRALSTLLIERLRSSTYLFIRLADDSRRAYTPAQTRERSTNAYAALTGAQR